MTEDDLAGLLDEYRVIVYPVYEDLGFLEPFVLP